MTAHLLLIALGPVQDFIAQARRTRDLWYGSHLLSEISRCAARSLVDQGARLIFPGLRAGDEELMECDQPLREGTSQPPLSIANKILAELPAGSEPDKVARQVRSDVQQFWKTKADTVRRNCSGLIVSDIDAIWDEQITTLLEFSACWAPLGEYRETRHKLERTLGGRKNLRDFVPWKHSRRGAHKSSLDGARESVLRPPPRKNGDDGRTEVRDAELVRRYRIVDSEQLDAVGLVKRAGGAPEQFVPLPNITIGPWLQLLREDPDKERRLGNLVKVCKDMGATRVCRNDLPVAGLFSVEARILFEGQWPSVLKELGQDDKLEWAARVVGSILEGSPPPPSYVACLVADGDHMGQLIDTFLTSADHHHFSIKLSEFAEEARRIVEQEHLGSLVYAGGDDVLAFVPVATALECSHRLQARFAEMMTIACGGTNPDNPPTLSVGLGIGHVQDGMVDLLELGREAGRLAKQGTPGVSEATRNAIAIIVDKRSGGRTQWRAQWPTRPVERLLADVELLRGRLPSRKVYEIRTTLCRLPDPWQPHEPGWAQVLQAEVKRSLKRSDGSRKLSLDDVGLKILPDDNYGEVHRKVSDWIGRMLVARNIADSTPKPQTKREDT